MFVICIYRFLYFAQIVAHSYIAVNFVFLIKIISDLQILCLLVCSRITKFNKGFPIITKNSFKEIKKTHNLNQ